MKLERLYFLIFLFSISSISVFAQVENIKAFEGLFTGQWNNTTFSSFGPASFDISVDEGASTIQIIMDLDGNVFGGSDPAPVTMNGTFSAADFTATGTSAELGTIQFNGDAAGNVTGSFTNVPGGYVDWMDFNGTYNHLAFNNNYTIYFIGGGGAVGAVGTILTNKQNAVNTPTNLGANSPSGTQVNLNWTDNSANESGFRIDRKEGSGNYSEIGTVGANITNYADNSVTSSTAYTYRIAAYNASTESEYSNTDDVTVGPATVNAPTNLTAQSNNPGEVDLVWTDNSDNEDGFKVERSPVSNSAMYNQAQLTWTEIIDLPAETESFTDTTPEEGGNYSYRVKAYNSATESDYSNEAAVIVMVTPITAPTNLSAVSNQPGEVELNWVDNADNEDGYKVERSENTSAQSVMNTLYTWVEIASLPSGSTYYLDATPTEGTSYSFRIKAFNSLTESEYSNIDSATVMPTPVADPTTLTAVSNEPVKITLGWNDNSDNEDGFKVERKSGSSNWSQIALLQQNVTAYEDSDVSGGGTYTYRVYAFNALSQSDYSNEASATAMVSSVAIPTNLIATSNILGSVDLSWTDNSDNEENFIIERKTDQTDWTEIILLTQNSIAYTDIEVEQGTFYSYRIKAVNAVSQSGYSNIATVTVGILPILPPDNLMVVSNSPGTADLAWTDNSDNETNFRVERKLDGENWTEITILGENISAYFDSGLMQGTVYYYRVQALNDYTTSDYSTEGMVVIDIASIDAPSFLTATEGTDLVDLGWTDNADNEDEFILERKSSLANFTIIASLPANAIDYQDSDVEFGETYTYRVKGKNEFTESEYSNEAIVTIVTSIDIAGEIPDKFQIHQNYPNPFNPSTKINFDVKEESNVKLVVFNIFGQVIATLVDEVMDQGAYRVEFDATNLPTGVYLYRIEMGNYHQTMKMILTK